jgi:NAD(P)-dependent dehydrogenase (short-subunit alcohol dehydrogenase family)
VGELGTFHYQGDAGWHFSLTGRDLRDWPGRRQRHSVTQSCFEIVHPLTAEPWGCAGSFVRALDGNVVNIVNHKDEHGYSRRPHPQRSSAPGGRPGIDSRAARSPAGQSGGAARLGWPRSSAALGRPGAPGRPRLTDDASVLAAATALRGDPGRLDVLVNNAAAYVDWAETATDADLDAAERVMATNVYGPLAQDEGAPAADAREPPPAHRQRLQRRGFARRRPVRTHPPLRRRREL